MARAERETTKYPGIYKRVINTRDGSSKGRIVYDIKIKNDWLRGKFTILEDARRERERLLGQAANGYSIKRGTTVADYAESTWLPHQEAKIASGRMRETTLAEYHSALRAHVLPAFGDKRLGDVTPLDVERFFDDLTRAGLAPFSLLNIRKPLNGIFHHATKNRLLPFNPVTAVEPPKQTRRREPHRLALADVWRLADAAPTRRRPAPHPRRRLHRAPSLRAVRAPVGERLPRIRSRTSRCSRAVLPGHPRRRGEV